MEKRKRRQHNAQKRGLVIVNEHRPFVGRTPGGTGVVAELETAVADQATSLADQENGHFEHQAAVDRAEKGRRMLQDFVKLFATVSNVVAPASGTFTPFDPSRPANDDELIARVDAIHAAVSTDPEAFMKRGIGPDGLDALAAELAAFRKAKDTMTLSAKQHNEAAARLERALGEGAHAIRVIEGLLATTPNAPAGALEALKAAKRIGPRIEDDGTTTPEDPATPAPTNTTHTPAPASVPVPNTVAD